MMKAYNLQNWIAMFQMDKNLERERESKHFAVTSQNLQGHLPHFIVLYY